MSSELQKYEKGAYDSRFSIFSPLTIDVATNKENKVRYFPLVKPSAGQVVEFVIPPSNFQYTDFSKCTLQCKISLQTNSGVDVTDDNKVALANMPVAALYRQCDVYLNQVLMTGDVNIHYGYKSVIDTLLTKSSQYLKTVGATFMFYYDTAGQMDTVGLGDTGVNEGLVNRWKRTKSGNSVQIETPLYLDLCELNQYLISGVEIRLVLHPADQKVAIMTGETTQLYKVDISDHQLIWDYVEPTTAVLYHHNELLTSSPAVS